MKTQNELKSAYLFKSGNVIGIDNKNAIALKVGSNSYKVLFEKDTDGTVNYKIQATDWLELDAEEILFLNDLCELVENKFDWAENEKAFEKLLDEWWNMTDNNLCTEVRLDIADMFCIQSSYNVFKSIERDSKRLGCLGKAGLKLRIDETEKMLAEIGFIYGEDIVKKIECSL